MPKVVMKEKMEVGEKPAFAKISTPTKVSGALSKPFDFELQEGGAYILVRDYKGRLLRFKKMSNLERGNVRMMIIKLHGAEVAKDDQTMSEYNSAAALHSIDGQLIEPYATMRELDFRKQLLDDDGNLAYVLTSPFLYPSMSQEEMTEVAKKLLTTQKS